MCGNQFETLHWRKFLCSAECAAEFRTLKAKSEAASVRKFKVISCETCGSEFTISRPHTLNCSDKCSQLYQKSQALKMRSIWYEKRMSDADFRREYNLKARIKKRKRDAVKDGATIGSEKLMNEWERSWRSHSRAKCFWCLGFFKSDTCHTDHIIPLAKDGSHCVENLCISCAGCNLKKGANDFNLWNSKIKEPALL